MEERRAHRRVSTALEIEITSGGEGWISLSTNLSLGGVRMKNTMSLALGDELEMLLHLGDEKIPLKGRVRWRSPEGDSCGVEFNEVPDEARARLEAHIAALE